MSILEDWIALYNPKSQEDFSNAKREIVQEIALTGLSRAGFFDNACFYGGTALRIFYGLDRFSEDLDFSLLEKNVEFSLQPYFDNLVKEFEVLGLNASISIKSKKQHSAIESAFLKQNSDWSFLEIASLNEQTPIRVLKVKIEVDRDPPMHFQTESKLLMRPYSNYIRCMTLDNLFAGKMHALLFRQWINNEKGRDWYDFVWYVARNASLNLDHFNARATASGNLNNNQPYTMNVLKDQLHQRVDRMKLEMAVKDISRFVKDQSKIDIWSKSYFHDVVDSMRI